MDPIAKNSLVISIITMGGLSFLFSLLLVIADKKLHVDIDQRIEKIYELLPRANCGACGCAGCFDFAVQVVDGKLQPNKCTISDQTVIEEISSLLGIESGKNVKKVARVLCRGSDENALNKSNIQYRGPEKCAAQALVSGGDRLCMYGCLGGGDCVEACIFGAMFMGSNGLPVIIEDKCTGCGLCVQACPRNIIELHPVERNFFVFCKNRDDAKTASKICKAACTACGICARNPEGGISIENNLAVINYDKLDISKVPFEKCKTGAIGFLNNYSVGNYFENTADNKIKLDEK